jgi:hypothetical protein
MWLVKWEATENWKVKNRKYKPHASLLHDKKKERAERRREFF